jgi:hypothetical protein
MGRHDEYVRSVREEMVVLGKVVIDIGEREVRQPNPRKA